ncbi:MAG: tetratricopeptide repeat protein [Gemmatimonadota bacterium]
MSEPFLSSDDYDEQAHQLYNEARYDEALTLLREGLSLYPHAVELHVGLAYAHLAREEFAWAARAFEAAIALDPDHEDALAGFGEVLLKIGRREEALRQFEHILALGFDDDCELMLQLGRACFREGLHQSAYRYFELSVQGAPDLPEPAACAGYASHRLGLEAQSIYWLRRALESDPEYVEARVYLANLLYDKGEYAAALHQLERSQPEDHFDELGLWRYIELRKEAYRLPDDDPELAPWLARLGEIAGEPDPLDLLLSEIESQASDGTLRDPTQLELFGTLLTELAAMQKRPMTGDAHTVATLTGRTFRGTWDEILSQMKEAEAEWAHRPMDEFMLSLAERGRAETGIKIPMTTAEEFIAGSAEAGVLRIIS